AKLLGAALMAALVAVALLKQQLLLDVGAPAPPLFGLVAVATAAALVLLTIVAGRRAGGAALARLARETPARRRCGLALAAGLAAAWQLEAVMTDRVVGDAGGLNFSWTLNDAIAVLDGRTPFVDYHVIYAKLLPYPTALVLGAFGTTTLAYTLFMAALNVLALLAVYGVFRLLARSSLLALVLLVPFMAVSDSGGVPIYGGQVSPMTLSAMWPMRYGGVFLLAWLTARHLAGLWPRRAWVVFLVGGLVAINTLEFGAGALAATLAALVCARPPRSWRAGLRLAAEGAGGIAAAVALVAIATVARAGALPRASLLLEWPRIFTTLGWFSLPLPLWGLHLAIYATFAAAVLVAGVRLARRDADALLTGMLAWSGVFGLCAGGYFVGRPDLQRLGALLAAWSFALTPLTIVVARELTRRGWRRPRTAELLVLLGFALSVCSIARFPLPWREVERLTSARPAPTYLASTERFVGSIAQPGERIAILVPMSFRIAHDLGLRNVAPYGFMNAVVTRDQMRTLLDAIERARVADVVTPKVGSFLLQEGEIAPEQLRALFALGYRPVAEGPGLLDLRRG
ncbi:MAG TPA: hypothetical protein VFU94_03375, partial [Conexibacter sp.]|nr:hypothetical protein [Conexibacter sp.]